MRAEAGPPVAYSRPPLLSGPSAQWRSLLRIIGIGWLNSLTRSGRPWYAVVRVRGEEWQDWLFLGGLRMIKVNGTSKRRYPVDKIHCYDATTAVPRQCQAADSERDLWNGRRSMGQALRLCPEACPAFVCQDQDTFTCGHVGLHASRPRRNMKCSFGLVLACWMLTVGRVILRRFGGSRHPSVLWSPPFATGIEMRVECMR